GTVGADAARPVSQSPSRAFPRAGSCAATSRKSWSRPTPRTRPRPAPPSPPSPPCPARRCSMTPRARSRRSPAPAPCPREALQHDLKGPLATIAATPQPFEVVIQRRYNPEGITSYNIVPGLVATILTMTLVMMTSLAMTRETERGTMETLLSTPLRPIEVMVGKLTPFVLVGIIQATLIITMARLLFGVPMAGGWAALILGLFLFIVGSLALGFLVST